MRRIASTATRNGTKARKKLSWKCSIECERRHRDLREVGLGYGEKGVNEEKCEWARGARGDFERETIRAQHIQSQKEAACVLPTACQQDSPTHLASLVVIPAGSPPLSPSEETFDRLLVRQAHKAYKGLQDACDKRSKIIKARRRIYM